MATQKVNCQANNKTCQEALCNPLLEISHVCTHMHKWDVLKHSGTNYIRVVEHKY